MDDVQRRRLERIAWNRAAATGDDEERWSFVFKTPGAIGYFFCHFLRLQSLTATLRG
ncbi:hypothetical protein [Mesorhizobium waimense]|uniref:hypothetical protein n=1 Tax=Mesorhizobium waimense TaxID=1300307 RepID=UPI00142DC508|nr:hypothetical protein [Mesorhizobium waimense]